MKVVYCIRTLYSGANVWASVNSFLSNKIPTERGVGQGDFLSPMLYFLCVEVLTCKLRACSDIEGFLLPGAERNQFKVGQGIRRRSPIQVLTLPDRVNFGDPTRTGILLVVWS